MIIIISGHKQTGKNTVTDFIKEEFDFAEYAFAGPIKQICKVAFGWDDSYFESTDKKEAIDEEWGISPRQALQWIGTEGFQFGLCKSFPSFENKTGRHIWVDKFVQDFKNGEFNCFSNNVVISDNRFPHESKVIKDKLSHIPSLLVKIVKKGTIKNDMHFSEIAIDDLPYDVIINNDGTLQDLLQETITKLSPYINGRKSK